jgi:glycerol kinase
MSDKYVLALDQGSTTTKSLLLNLKNPLKPEIISLASVAIKTIYPQNSWVEHDLEDIWRSVIKSIDLVLKKAQKKNSSFNSKNISSIGITNQRETLCLFDPDFSKPQGVAISWQCKRSDEICQNLKKQDNGFIKSKTGLSLDPYFSASKLRWSLKNSKNLQQQLLSQKILWGTVDTFLIYSLTGKYLTDHSNASRTLLYNLETSSWDPELLDFFSLPKGLVFPEIKDSGSFFGNTKNTSGLCDGIPITGVLGDQQASLVGQKCISQGDTKCTYGTGAFLLQNIGSKKNIRTDNLLTTVAWSYQNSRVYALEGSCFSAGSALDFFKDNLSLDISSEDLNYPETVAPDLYFVPAFSGLGSPYWQPHARATFWGLSKSTTKKQLIKAVLEGVALQVQDVLQELQEQSGLKLKSLQVDGGMSQNQEFLKFQSLISQTKINCQKLSNSTAFGAALFAALGCQIYQDMEEVKKIKLDSISYCTKSNEDVGKIINKWKLAVSLTTAFK